jgi:hypothetical protein
VTHTEHAIAKPRKSFSLMQKLTMLVAFPLVFEFVFVGSLAALLVTAQADTRRIEAAILVLD